MVECKAKFHVQMRRRRAGALLTLLLAAVGHAAEPGLSAEVEYPTAPVSIDGTELFRVRGVSVYPAAQRAERIESRILGLAADRAFAPAQLTTVATEQTVDIGAGTAFVMSLYDADGSLARLDKRTLADLYARRIRQSVQDYRASRTPEYLKRGALRAAAATLITAASLWLILRLTRLLAKYAQARYRERVKSIAIQSFQILHSQQIWSALLGLLRTIRYTTIGVALYLYTQYVLSQFPTTRGLARQLLDYLIDPLATLWHGFMGVLPDLIFLAVLTVVTRYVLRILRLFFDSVSRGAVALDGFDPDWAAATYRIASLAVVLFAIIIAYPFIPGSGSEAFKGISIFLGVMFSIGSTSFIANFVAGYALIYRRVFKVGDWIRVGDVLGEVVLIRLQVTHLRSLRNEEIIVPNSVVLNTEVMNYSSLGRTRGLIIHAAVSIGYETPWRKVEAMLLLAARRTPGLLQEPIPFVQQVALGDFAITYEINAHCNTPEVMMRLRSALHRSILDVFNEYGVQIMTPAYEGDPAIPKIVAVEHWHASPAAPAAES